MHPQAAGARPPGANPQPPKTKAQPQPQHPNAPKNEKHEPEGRNQ
jgi:hypothetical protein